MLHRKSNGPSCALFHKVAGYHARPKQVNVGVLAGNIFDRLFEAGDNSAFDSENLKELVPKGLLFRPLAFALGFYLMDRDPNEQQPTETPYVDSDALTELVKAAAKSRRAVPSGVVRLVPLLLALADSKSAPAARRVLSGGRALRKEAFDK